MDSLRSLLDIRAGLEFANEWWLVIFLAVTMFAWMEISCEGRDGWALKLPTWYRFTGWFARIYSFVSGRKPLTGYHLPMNIFMVTVLFFATNTHLLAGILIFLVIGISEDFLWFQLNPNFGWSGFRKENIWWHENTPWLLGFPSYYYQSIGVALAASWVLGCLPELWSLTWKILIATAAATILVAPLFRRWYATMQKQDQRHLIPTHFPNRKNE